MSYSEEYQGIRRNFASKPNYIKESYNINFATSKHAKKLPVEEGRERIEEVHIMTKSDDIPKIEKAAGDRDICKEDWTEGGFICKRDLDVLEKARSIYGYKNQILVVVEELNELASILTKYPRYDKHDDAIDKIFDRVLDEYADVIIVLNHVKHIANIADPIARERVYSKIRRLERWMTDDPSFEHTMEDREILTPVSEKDKGIKELCGDCPLPYPDGCKDSETECNKFQQRLGIEFKIPLDANPQEIGSIITLYCHTICKRGSYACAKCPDPFKRYMDERLDNALSRV